MSNTKQDEMIMGNLVHAVGILHDCPEFSFLIPEVKVNIVYASPGAKTPDDVAAIDGRITVVRGLPHASGVPRWGASDHMARLIIEIRKYDDKINAGINFKCDKTIIKVLQKYCIEKGLLFGWIDRTDEPPKIIERDGVSISWKIRQLVTSCSGVPKLFYEGEGWGKESLFFALGDDAIEVADRAVELARYYQQRTKG